MLEQEDPQTRFHSAALVVFNISLGDLAIFRID